MSRLAASDPVHGAHGRTFKVVLISHEQDHAALLPQSALHEWNTSSSILQSFHEPWWQPSYQCHRFRQARTGRAQPSGQTVHHSREVSVAPALKHLNVPNLVLDCQLRDVLVFARKV